MLDAWSLQSHLVTPSAISWTRASALAWVLDAALYLRRPRAGLVHHSGRGVQYASQAYRSRLAAHRIRGSRSRRGNPYDNAHVESFFKTLKHEEIFANDYSTIVDVAERLPTSLRRYTIADAYTPRWATCRPRSSRVFMQLEAADWSIQATPPVHLQGFTPRPVQLSMAVDTHAVFNTTVWQGTLQPP